MKPRKTWSVGDKTFETYAEALREANACRRSGLQQEVLEKLHSLLFYRLEDDHSDAIIQDIAEAITRELFANFNISRKKGASRVES